MEMVPGNPPFWSRPAAGAQPGAGRAQRRGSVAALLAGRIALLIACLEMRRAASLLLIRGPRSGPAISFAN